MAFLGELVVSIKGDDSDLNKTIDGAEKKTSSFAKKFGKAGIGFAKIAATAIVGIGAAVIKVASDAEETRSKFNTVFSDIKETAQAASEDLANSFDLASSTAQKLIGDTGDLLTGFGFTQESALDLSKQVQELAIDLASFTNFSGGAEGASQALTKALLGERESIKSLGISILEEDVKKQVLINTNKGLTFETERQAKAYATLQLAQQQSKNAIGDYQRTQAGFANQIRKTGQQVIELADALGQKLLPFATSVITQFNNGIDILIDFIKGTSELSKETDKLTELYKEYKDITDQLTDSTRKLSSEEKTLLEGRKLLREI